MAKFAVPCQGCGEPSKSTYCTECARAADRARIRETRTKTSPESRGYDSAWKRLSKRARAAQPFCSDCGSTEDLQADHSPEAWRRKERGLPLRICDVDVVCGRCNRERGAARGDDVRAAEGGRSRVG